MTIKENILPRTFFSSCKVSAAICSIVFILAALTSCSDSDGVEDHTYDRWQERNDSAFHAVFTEAQKAIEQGSKQWRIIRRTDSTLPTSESNSIVVRIDKEGTGTECPYYTDSVRVNYIGSLLTGKTFDHSGFYADYESVFSPQLCRPASMLVSGTVPGFATALQYMHLGDIWHVWMPQQLGYGKEKKDKIPAYSMLQFDIQLVQYARRGQPLPVWK